MRTLSLKRIVQGMIMFQEIEKKLTDGLTKKNTDTNNKQRSPKRESDSESGNPGMPGNLNDLIYQLTPETQTSVLTIDDLQDKLENLLKKFQEKRSQLEQLKDQNLANNYKHFSLTSEAEFVANAADKNNDAPYNTNIYERLYYSMLPLTTAFLNEFKQLLENIGVKYNVSWNNHQKKFSLPTDPSYYTLVDSVYGLLEQFLSVIAEINQHYPEKSFILDFAEIDFIPAEAIYTYDFSNHLISQSIVGNNLSSTDLSRTKVRDTTFSGESEIHVSESLTKARNNNEFYGCYNFYSYHLDNYENNLDNENNASVNFNRTVQKALRSVLFEFKWIIDSSKDFHDFCYELHDRVTKIYKIMCNLMGTEGLASKFRRSSIELTYRDCPTEQHLLINAMKISAITKKENELNKSIQVFKKTLNDQCNELGVFLSQSQHSKKSLATLAVIVNKYSYILSMDQDILTAAEIAMLTNVVQAEEISQIKVPEEISDQKAMIAFLQQTITQLTEKLNLKINKLANFVSAFRMELKEPPVITTVVSDAAKGMYI